MFVPCLYMSVCPSARVSVTLLDFFGKEMFVVVYFLLLLVAAAFNLDLSVSDKCVA